LYDFHIDKLKTKPPDCSCHNFPFKYNPDGHVVTGDMGIIDNENLRKILAKDPKYRETQSINWKYNFKLLMDFVENCTRKWTKPEKEEVNTLSESCYVVDSNSDRQMNTKATSVFKDPEGTETLSTIHDKYVIVHADKDPKHHRPYLQNVLH